MVGKPNFNPRPREEGDFDHLQYAGEYNISIHALVKRATKYMISDMGQWYISIHALVKRATKLPVCIQDL